MATYIPVSREEIGGIRFVVYECGVNTMRGYHRRKQFRVDGKVISKAAYETLHAEANRRVRDGQL